MLKTIVSVLFVVSLCFGTPSVVLGSCKGCMDAAGYVHDGYGVEIIGGSSTSFEGAPKAGGASSRLVKRESRKVIDIDSTTNHYHATHGGTKIDVEVHRDYATLAGTSNFQVELKSTVAWYKCVKVTKGGEWDSAGMVSAQDCTDDDPGISATGMISADKVSNGNGYVRMHVFKAMLFGVHDVAADIFIHKDDAKGSLIIVTVTGD